MEKQLENATIIFKNGVREFCDFVSIRDKGVFIGRVKSNEGNKTFNVHRFVPKDQIKRIIISDRNCKPKDVNL
jgi:hypothetical protein